MTEGPGDVEDRLRRLEDRAQLWELVARYALAVDDEDYDTVAGLFAPDGQFVGLTGEPATGPDAVVAYLRERAEGQRGRAHVPTAQILDGVGGDRVAGTVLGCAAHFNEQGDDLFIYFRYDDEYVRRDGRWYFRRRRPHAVKPLPT